MAPEVILNNKKYGNGCLYGHSIDVWALGTFLYFFIEGHIPFNAEDLNGIYTKILNCQYSFTDDKIREMNGRKPISFEAKQLIKEMLSYHAHDRPTLD